jgi:peptidoglycan/LPS O-acetylase OafA/YrhL
MGMSLFFSLSGFLITSFMVRRPQVRPFLIRRLCRIVPLAWAFVVVTLLLFGADAEKWMTNLLFLLNYNTDQIEPYNSHFWSLCVEMHFYLFVAALVGMAGRRGLLVLPVVCMIVTGLRVYEGVTISIVTHFRVDEILAGAIVALLWYEMLPGRLSAPLRGVPPWIWLIVFVIVSNPYSGPAQFARPYCGALLVGSTLYQPDHWLVRPLANRLLRYLATVSYAVYVIHGPLRIGWFSEGSTAVRYLFKRPITFALTFLLAHLSTFYWEARWIELGRRLTRRRQTRPDSAGQVAPVESSG